MKVDTVLFDLDGTIIDSNELIIATFMDVLRDAAVKPLLREHIVTHMGKPLQEQLRLLSGRESVDDLEQAYRKINLARHDQYLKVFPHVEEVIAQLHGSGIKLGVVTTKIRETTKKGLVVCGLSPYFETIVTIEDVIHPKPHPEPVLKAIEALQADPKTTLMVGDSPADILSANQAGVRSAAVSWSLKGADYLQQFAPHMILEDIREILTLTGLAEERR